MKRYRVTSAGVRNMEDRFIIDCYLSCGHRKSYSKKKGRGRSNWPKVAKRLTCLFCQGYKNSFQEAK